MPVTFVIAGFFLIGILLVRAAWRIDRRASIADNSFLLQTVTEVSGIFFIGASILAALIKMLVV